MSNRKATGSFFWLHVKLVFSVWITLLCCTAKISFAQWVPNGYGTADGSCTSIVNAGGNLLVGTPTVGVYLSSDNGSSWHQSNTGLTQLRVNTLFFFNSRTFAGTPGGVYISMDKGITWSATGLPGEFIYSFTAIGNTLFAASSYRVYSSSDNGVTWNPADSSGLTNGSSSLLINGTNILAGSSNGDIFISNDGGLNWNKTATIGFIYTFGSVGNILLAGTNTGLYRSSDGGLSWTMVVNGPTDALAFFELNGDILAGTPNGVIKSSDKGLTWTPTVSPGDLGLCTGFAASGNNLFLATYYSGVLRSVDNGSTWSPSSSNGLTRPQVNCFVTKGDTIVVGTYNEIYRSADHGTNWTTANTGLALSPTTSLAVINNYFFASIQNEGVYKSIDGGATWSSCNAGLPSLEISSITSIGDTVFVGTSQGVFQSSDNGNSWSSAGLSFYSVNALTVRGTTLFATLESSGFFRSTDSGVTWTPITGDLPSVSIYKMTSGPTTVYVATYGGVYFSNDDGSTWTELSSTFRNRIVTAMAAGADNLFIATDPEFQYVFSFSKNSSVSITSGLPINSTISCFQAEGSVLMASVNGSGGYGSIWKYPISTIPSIDSFSPTEGGGGTIMTIDGLNFSSIASENIVQLNDLYGTVISASANKLQVVVPFTHGKFPIRVTVNKITAVSNNSFSIKPEIKKFEPNRGPVNTLITIHGTGFDSKTTRVMINGKNINQYSTDNKTIYGAVPDGATSGLLSITIGNETFFSSDTFYVVPHIDQFFPTKAPVDAQVVLTGSGFDPITSNNIVRFNGVRANVTLVYQDNLYVVVPPGLVSGNITVEVCKNIGTSPTPFTLFPLPVECFTLPPKPIITDENVTESIALLKSSSRGGNQWFLNGIAIPQAKDSIFIVQQSGIYTVQVTIDGCSSPLSDGQPIVVTNLEKDPISFAIEIFPNPASDKITVKTNNIKSNEEVEFEINDLIGHTLLQLVSVGEVDTTIDIATWSKGIYILKITKGLNVIQRKFVKY